MTIKTELRFTVDINQRDYYLFQLNI